MKDTQGVPLPGVTVMIDGTTVGVTTNANGKFEIAKPASGKILFVFYLYRYEVTDCTL